MWTCLRWAENPCFKLGHAHVEMRVANQGPVEKESSERFIEPDETGFESSSKSLLHKFFGVSFLSPTKTLAFRGLL